MASDTRRELIVIGITFVVFFTFILWCNSHPIKPKHISTPIIVYQPDKPKIDSYASGDIEFACISNSALTSSTVTSWTLNTAGTKTWTSPK